MSRVVHFEILADEVNEIIMRARVQVGWISEEDLIKPEEREGEEGEAGETSEGTEDAEPAEKTPEA